MPHEATTVNSVKRDVEQAGLTNIGFSIGIRRLLNKDFVEVSEEQNQYGHTYYILLKEAGWDWVEANESKFTMIHFQEEYSPPPPDDEIPF